ncbi:oxidative stress survival Svf1-like protein [Gymnopilus junonius]|uniref:Oxidative stress survival Svf1-like protein n=1 Tax=Gymnopilus junonius TaxID=109634 RepID=A0A9P5NUI4_GYMJU|nr:oxidative stress survival Svf1-like protein [Gymnopilus junonius]
MFSSIFSTAPPVDPHAPNFHSVSSKFPESELFGELEHKDNEWICAGGFVAETQTFYINAEDGTSIMCQVIHSSVGVWFPTIQFTCKIANPAKGEKIWKSINVNNFVTPAPGYDKRSSKADEYSILFKSNPGSEFPETISIRANLGVDLQVSLELQQPASIPGFKVGKGPEGGYSYFGTDPNKADGYVVHRFWPLVRASGHLIRHGKAEPLKGAGMFVHAIQGMRPNLVASRWNFGFFHSDELGGISAIQMEFTTTDTHGKRGSGSGGVVINVGSLVIGDKLACVTTETKWPGEELARNLISRTTHLNLEHDPDTTYDKPNEILFEWKGPSIVADAPGTVEAKLQADLGTVADPKGLIEKVISLQKSHMCSKLP